MKISAQHILVNHEHIALDLQKKLAEGSSFEDLARDFSECPSGQQGGDLGEFGRGMMVPSFEKAAWQLMPGEVSGIVRTQFGFHLIKRTR